MNSTTILFLKMFRDDLKRHVMNGVPQNASGDLMGSKIKMSEIEGLASYKLMNSHEKEILIHMRPRHHVAGRMLRQRQCC